MKVLHITNWYPSEYNPYEALWVKRHIDALRDSSEDVSCKVWHFEVFKGRPGVKVSRFDSYTNNLLLFLPILAWKLIELIHFVFLLWVLWRESVNKNYDLLNFHIAYPQMRYFHWISQWIRIPVVISEHWSAYHYHFNIPGSNKLSPIKQIFRHQIPVITVSEALGKDIKEFAAADFQNWILPNIVDPETFVKTRSSPDKSDPFFLMVSQWKYPKMPELAIKAFLFCANTNDQIQLKIVGYGPQIELMEKVAQAHDRIEFLGPKEPNEIADLMNKAIALIHPSGYETFSVVCAEAVMSKCPVIASRVGGVPEFVGEHNGVLVENSVENFLMAMEKCLKSPPPMDKEIDFSKRTIGKKYFYYLQTASNKSVPILNG